MYSDTEPVLHIGRVEDRKQFALYVTYDGGAHPLAYFRSRAAAALATEFFAVCYERPPSYHDSECAALESAVVTYLSGDDGEPEAPDA